MIRIRGEESEEMEAAEQRRGVAALELVRSGRSQPEQGSAAAVTSPEGDRGRERARERERERERERWAGRLTEPGLDTRLMG